jgi:predicted Rossmann-fold nucleotide-binding protein
MTPKSPVIYLPGLPSLSSRDIGLYKTIYDSRFDLVTQLDQAGYMVEDIDGQHPWLKTMVDYAEHSDGFLFTPMTALPENHPRFKREAAQRWFEFFSLVTGVHIGHKEKYGASGVAKPCIVMDPDGQWAMVVDVLRDLHNKGMFSSEVEEIVQVVRGNGSKGDYHTLNRDAIAVLRTILTEGKGKSRKDVHYLYPEKIFEPFRKNMPRHPFGIAIFGSASTKEQSYMDRTFALAEMAGLRGWRMITGAGNFGCMKAADSGFNQGKLEFNARWPDAPFKPAHVGVSSQAILQLEGPPPHLEQLVITNHIYDRMEVMIRGQKMSDPAQRTRDATKVLFVVPGGTGTLHELATLLQLATNGSMMKDRTIVIANFPSHLNPEQGFWDPLIKNARRLGFDSLFEVANTPEEAIAIADRVYQEWLLRHEEYRNLPHPVFCPA